MNNTEIASFIWYIAFMLVPIVPAVIIYKLFPATQVGANGMLGNLKINATGAFAAYIITALLGFMYVKDNGTGQSIAEQEYKTWEVSSKLEFVDKNGKKIRGSLADSMTRKTNVALHPGNIVYQQNGIIRFLITARNTDDIIVNYSFPGFNNQTYTLADLKPEDINIDRGTVTMGTVTMNEEEMPYMASLVDTTMIPLRAPASRVVREENGNRGPASISQTQTNTNVVVKEVFGEGPPLEGAR